MSVGIQWDRKSSPLAGQKEYKFQNSHMFLLYYLPCRLSISNVLNANFSKRPLVGASLEYPFIHGNFEEALDTIGLIFGPCTKGNRGSSGSLNSASLWYFSTCPRFDFF